MFVVAVVVVTLVALGYYYTAGQDQSAGTVTVAVRGYLSQEQKRALAAQFTGYAPEERTETELRVFEFPASENAGGQETSKLLTSLLAELQSGPSDLYLLDGYVWALIGNETLFEDLSARYPGDPALVDGYRYAVAGKPFVNASGLEELPELFLALRSSATGAVNKNAATLAEYELQAELLDNIAGSTPPEDFAAQTLE